MITNRKIYLDRKNPLKNFRSSFFFYRIWGNASLRLRFSTRVVFTPQLRDRFQLSVKLNSLKWVKIPEIFQHIHGTGVTILIKRSYGAKNLQKFVFPYNLSLFEFKNTYFLIKILKLGFKIAIFTSKKSGIRGEEVEISTQVAKIRGLKFSASPENSRKIQKMFLPLCRRNSCRLWTSHAIR